MSSRRSIRPSSLTKALHKIISEARKVTSSPHSQPAISSIILERPAHWKKVKSIRGLSAHLIAVGLAAEVRRFLKIDPDDAGSITTSQLDLWPTSLRKAVADIGMARVFVPSRGEFILLVPLTISSGETEEAGQYLIGKGNDCIRRGGQLVRLAQRMRK